MSRREKKQGMPGQPRPTCYRCNKERLKPGLGGPRKPLEALVTSTLDTSKLEKPLPPVKNKVIPIRADKKHKPGDGWIWNYGIYVCGDCLRLFHHRQPPPPNAPADWRYVENECRKCGVGPETACPSVIAELVGMGRHQNETGRPIMSATQVQCPGCGARANASCKPHCKLQSRKGVEVIGADTDAGMFAIEERSLLKRIKRKTGYG